ncbi:MAG: hypothetical protein ACR2MX_14030 [Cyclobacteriaceae bacterium]
MITLVMVSACGKPYYLSSTFQDKTKDHEVIAILPVEMIFLGVMPEGLSENDILAIEEAESQAFQISLSNEILRSVKGGKRPLSIDFQPYSTTNQILQENGISIREIWRQSPESLASLLQVDAVVKGRIEKYRYMSDLASYGIYVATDVIAILSQGALSPYVPLGLGKTNDILASCALHSGDDGLVLWSMSQERSADWGRPAPVVIDDINRRLARHFPYRE